MRQLDDEVDSATPARVSFRDEIQILNQSSFREGVRS
jgi:hypothetical protein